MTTTTAHLFAPSVVTPREGAYAGIVSRTVAFVIDVILVVIALAGAAAVMYACGSALGVRATRTLTAAAKATSFVGLPVLFVLYCAAGWALIGKTVGMMLMGVRVVTKNGTRPRLWRALLRGLAYAVSAILMLGFAWIAVDRRRQGFHDKIARTFVVYDPAS